MLLVLLIHTSGLLIVTAQQNLTPFGKATQSSQSGRAGPINAIKPPIANTWSFDYCTHTVPGSKAAWWMFHFSFGSSYITDITIYYRGSFAYRMDGFELYVTNTSTIPPDGYLCYKDGSGLPSTTQTISCNQLGQYVIYYDNEGDSANGPIVELCYVAINGCPQGRWGSSCEQNCVKCLEQNCYPATGFCVWGCSAENCLNAVCEKDTAVCTLGCDGKQTGNYCDKYNIASIGDASQYPSGSQQASLATDGDKTTCSKTTGANITFQIDLKVKSIVTGLYIILGESTPKDRPHTIYGSNNSNSWNIGNVLYSGTSVPTEINLKAFFRYLTYVSSVDDQFADLELCEVGIIGCPPTNYGPMCNTTCPENCNGPCDPDTGNCTFGCKYGWTGTMCKEECRTGKFGKGCLETCSANCANPKCNHLTGACIGDCNGGWQGFNCSQECPDSQFGRNCSGVCEGCVNSMCDHVSGRCDNTTHCNSGYEYSDFCDHLCDDGDFGIDCAQKCYCLTEPCSKGEGICPPVGCKEGWHGESCNMECSSGYFGRNCKHSCLGCLSHTCDRIDGLCKNTTGCKPGYLYTEFCNKTCDDGYFGQNCTGKCKCSTCNITTGSCGESPMMSCTLKLRKRMVSC